MGRYRSANRADLTALCLVASCALFVTTAVWADPSRYDQLQTDQFQDEQPQPKHKKRMVHRVDAVAQVRHQMRDKMNSGLVGIVSEGTDETVDMALALTAQAEHERLRILPIAEQVRARMPRM